MLSLDKRQNLSDLLLSSRHDMCSFPMCSLMSVRPVSSFSFWHVSGAPSTF